MSRFIKRRFPATGDDQSDPRITESEIRPPRGLARVRPMTLLTLAAIVAGALLLSACGGSDSETGGEAEGGSASTATTATTEESGASEEEAGASEESTGTAESTGEEAIEDNPGGTLTMLSTNPIGAADASTVFMQEAYVLERPAYVGLMADPAKGGEAGSKVIPGVAAAMPKPSDGGKTWTFKLRKGLKFSNGEEFTPADVPFSIKRIFVLGGGPAYYLSDLLEYESCTEEPKSCSLSKSVEVDEKNWTVTFHLGAADGFFPEKLSVIYMVPSSTPMKVQSFTAALGPYMWKTNDNRESVLVRNPEYKDGTFEEALFPVANPDEIVEKYGVSAQQEATEVINGQADYMWDEVPGDQLNEVATKSPEQVKINASPFVEYAFLNTKVAPFSSKQAREAINYAANRAAYVNAVGGERVASVSCQVVPASVKGYEPFCPWTESGEGEWSAPELTKAKQLVKESGTEGESVEVVIENTAKALGEQLVDDLNSIGYKASMKLLTPSSAYGYQQNSSNEPQAGISFWQSSIGGGLVFINLLSCGSFHPESDASPNLAEYCNKSIDAEIASVEKIAVTNLEGAFKKVAEIDKKLTAEAPWLTLYNHQDVDIVSSRLKGYVYSPLSQFLPDVASVE